MPIFSGLIVFFSGLVSWSKTLVHGEIGHFNFIGLRQVYYACIAVNKSAAHSILSP